MRIANPPPSADLFNTTIRWLFLIIITLWLGINGGVSSPLMILIIVGIGANIIGTIIAYLARMTQTSRIFSVIGDVAFSLLTLFFSGTLRGDLIWISFLPLATVSLYFQWLGVVSITILNLFVLGGMKLLGGFPFGQISLIDIFFLITQLIIGLPLAYISQSLQKDYFWPKTTQKPPQDDHKHRHAIFDLISALSSNLSYNKVLETSLDLSTHTLAQMNSPVDRLVSAVLLHSEDKQGITGLEVATSRRLLPTDKNVILPGTSGLIKEVIEEGLRA